MNWQKKGFQQAGSDIRKTWNNINKIIGKHKTMGIDETVAKYMCKNKRMKEIADNFGQEFKNIIAEIEHKCEKRLLEKDKQIYVVNMYIPKATVEQVKKIITNLIPEKSHGYDGMRIKDVIAVKETIASTSLNL